MNLDQRIVTTYLALTLSSTLATSFIWGIDTLFLLDSGLTIAQAFLVNGFFSVGQVLFEVPTGVIADTLGRRLSFLLGVLTLIVSTALYYWLWTIQGPVLLWIVASMTLGLGYTFFSGATEAWLVDALNFHRFKGAIDDVFAKGQVAAGVAMLTGSVAGGVIAQQFSLGLPYVVRSIVLASTFAIAWIWMKDEGFEPQRAYSPIKEFLQITKDSFKIATQKPALKWVVFTAPITGGLGFYTFYSLQPYLLELYGNEEAYAIAGLTAAIVAGAQILGGLAAARVRRFFKKRTTVLLLSSTFSVLALLLMGLVANFYLVLLAVVLWALLFSLSMPIRKAYVNHLVPSKQRASVLSFDALFASTGAAAMQPGLGRVASSGGFATAYVVSASLQLLTLPLLVLARKQQSEADQIKAD